MPTKRDGCCISCLLEFSSLSFGYVAEGAELLRDIKEGDIIVSATILRRTCSSVSGTSS
jgi:cyclophilin family peptidyl-prolyl cis-trans isomerase